MMSKIKKIKAREILDSRGWPTIEVHLETSDFLVEASVPSGTSKGKYEAVEIRDGGKRYLGRGVLKAVKNIQEIIAPRFKGRELKDQKSIDQTLIRLDGTKNKSKLGANAILAVSIAFCRAGAKARNLPLYEYISQLAENGSRLNLNLPTPCFLLIEGGPHARTELEIQEFMIVPQADSYREKLRISTEAYHTLNSILKQKYGAGATNVGDEGGFAAPLKKTKQALDLIIQAIRKAGFANKIKIALDVAATSFLRQGIYQFENKTLNREQLLKFYSEVIEKYPLQSIEDPFAEDDFEGFKMINEKFGKEILIFGDDLLVTNLERIKKAQQKRASNGLILKPNQIGTVIETIEAAKLAKRFGWKIMVSHRSGETNDTLISDLAVGVGADFIKSGAPARGERVAKYNRLLEIEEEVHSAS